MGPPASASRNRTHGAEKIGPSRYSDFFNKIGHKQTFSNLQGLFGRSAVALFRLSGEPSATEKD